MASDMDIQEMALFLSALFLLLPFVLGVGADQNECTVKRCRDNGPEIRFPYRLKDMQPEHCGYPGFDLYCTKSKHRVLSIQILVDVSSENIQLQHSAEVIVNNIDYHNQYVLVTSLEDCLERRLGNLSSSTSRVNLDLDSSGYTVFNCSKTKNGMVISPVSCLSRPPGYMVYAAASRKYLYEVSLSSCTKMYKISYTPYLLYSTPRVNPFALKWNIPSCGDCEEQGKYCRMKQNNTRNETECFDIPEQPTECKGATNKLIVAGIILGVFFSLLFAVALAYVLIANKRKKADEDKIERLLTDYKALKPSRYSYADIKIITNQFKEKLGQGGYGTVYKGRLSNEVLVAVKVLNTSNGNGEDFINEVGTIGRTHHVNVVRLVGYCADGFRRALIYEFLPNDTLQKFLSSENSRKELSLSKLQSIAIGIAEGIEYLHQGCDQQILHFDIKPQNVLMDQNFNPKISDFGLAKLCSKDKSVISMTLARGTIGYIAPEVFSRNFGKVSYKSDIYSFGMLLLDMVGARKNNQQENTSESYFLERTYNSLAKGEGLGFQIDINGDPSIAKKLTVIGLWCIQWFPSDRPSMRTVIQMLEGEDCPVIPPNPFASMSLEETTVSATVRRRVVPVELEKHF